MKSTGRKIEQSIKSSLKTKYGLSKADYDELFESQYGRCAICRFPEDSTYKGTRRRLSVDHNHTTGKVRGLLCFKCNLALGHLREDPIAVQTMLGYIEEHG